MSRGKNKGGRNVLSTPRTSAREKLADTMPGLKEQEVNFSEEEFDQLSANLEVELKQKLEPLKKELTREWENFSSGAPSKWSALIGASSLDELTTDNDYSKSYHTFWGLTSIWHLMGEEQLAQELARRGRTMALKAVEEINEIEGLYNRILGQNIPYNKTANEVINDLESYLISPQKNQVSSADIEKIKAFKDRIALIGQDIKMNQNVEYKRAEANLTSLSLNNWHRDDLNERPYYLHVWPFKAEWEKADQLSEKIKSEWVAHCKMQARNLAYQGKIGLAPVILWEGLTKFNCWSEEIDEYHEKLKDLVKQAREAQK